MVTYRSCVVVKRPKKAQRVGGALFDVVLALAMGLGLFSKFYRSAGDRSGKTGDDEGWQDDCLLMIFHKNSIECVGRDIASVGVSYESR